MKVGNERSTFVIPKIFSKKFNSMIVVFNSIRSPGLCAPDSICESGSFMSRLPVLNRVRF